MAGGRGSISPAETLKLWVAAGGRCQYHGCNHYLLEDELTGFSLNLAERAHVVGATDASGSPRGRSDLPLAVRNEVANLLLLCRDHHKLIDELIDEHGVEGLAAMKHRHEERIRLLTGLDEEAETAVLRVVGGIRGAPVEIPRDAVHAAVRADGRFPRYRFALAGEDIEVDLRGLPEEGGPAYWESGERVIAAQAARLRQAQGPIRHLSVFALTRIPLLVALGFHLDDKIPVSIYQRRRDGTGDNGWGFDPEAEPTSFQFKRISAEDGTRVALAVSLTAPIGRDVLALSADRIVYEIEPQDAPHSRNVLATRPSLDAFAETYHRFLASLEQEHPQCRELDLFIAAPAAAAIQLGRGLMRDTQPALVVYDRDSDDAFQPALTLERATIAPPAASQ
jgi:hypothetical protein